MTQTKTYQHKGKTVTIVVNVHCAFVTSGNGDYIPVNCITSTIEDEEPQVIENVKDTELDARLVRLEDSINAFIDATPAIVNQLQANGYN